ncbi:Lectin protein [Spatholobus suberectus]|nr:Lectin protein [Spatholobus suberectus]
MATSKLFLTQKPFSALVFISLTLFVVNKVNSAETQSFSFTKFPLNPENVILQGDARVTPTGQIQLTKVDETGNPIYNQNYNKSYHILAVEFDTYENTFDPPQAPHIGIDVNWIKSSKTSRFDLVNGQVANVFISYTASKNILQVALSCPSCGTPFAVADEVNLKVVLTEWALVGFSASTGLVDPHAVETHDILSWSFSSTLPGDNNANNIAVPESNAIPS